MRSRCAKIVEHKSTFFTNINQVNHYPRLWTNKQTDIILRNVYFNVKEGQKVFFSEMRNQGGCKSAQACNG